MNTDEQTQHTSDSLPALPVLHEREAWICIERELSEEELSWMRSEILAGSAIVAAPLDLGFEYVRIYYEGNVYRAANLERFEDRLSVAWGRLVHRAPTIAVMGLTLRAFVDRFEIVGTFDGGRTTMLAPNGEARLAQVQRQYRERTPV